MKTIKFTAFLFYKYYSTGATRRIPYFSMLCALVLAFYLHLGQILLIFNATDLIPTDGSQKNIGNFLKMGLFMLPIFFLFFSLVKEKELKEMTYSSKQIKRGYIFLVVYLITSFVVTMLLALYKAGRI